MQKSFKLHISWLQTLCMMILASVFFLSVMITGTYAWNTAASILNEFFGDSRSSTVVLEKYEKDIYGEVTDKPIEGASFSLYQIQEKQISANETTFEEVLLEKDLETDSDGRIHVGNLKAGEYFFIENSPTYLYTYDKDGEGTDIRKYSFEISAETLNAGEEVRVIAYNQRLTGQLLIRKTVENEDTTELTPQQIAQEFVFQIEFSEEGAYTYSIGGGEEQELVDGIITLRHGEEALFMNLPAGMEYSVREVPVSGYKNIAQNHQGNILAFAREEKITVVDYTNIREEQIIPTASLIIEKEVVDVDGNASEDTIDQQIEFQFLLTLGDDAEQIYTYQIERNEPNGSSKESLTIKSGDTIILHHGERAVFRNLPVGVFYEVEELETKGYTSLLKSQSGHFPSEQGREILFLNYRNDVDYPDTGKITVAKQITGEGADSEDTFDFYITFFDAEGNVLEREYPYQRGGESSLSVDGWSDGTLMFHLKGGESIVFEDLPAGISYIITEEDHEKEYLGGLKQMTGTVVGGSDAVILFQNHRDLHEEEQVELIVRKITTGENADVKKEFTFTFETEDYSEIFTLANGHEKKFYIPVGTTYKIEEQDTSSEGYLQTSVTNSYGMAAGQRIVIEKTNTKIPDIIDPDPKPGKKVSLHVGKEWQKDNNTVRPKSIQVQLYQDGKAYGTVLSMSGESGWNHTWTGLPDTYQWTVDELMIPDGYKKQVDGTIGGGFTITNTYTRSLPGGGGSDGEKNNPDDQEQKGEKGGAGTDQQKTAGREGDGDINSGSKAAKKVSAASTGDDMNIWLWVAVMVSSAVVLRRMLFHKNWRVGKG